MVRYWTTDFHRKVWGKFYINTSKWVLGIGGHYTPIDKVLTFSLLLGPFELGFSWRRSR